jgi:hypothetical protein
VFVDESLDINCFTLLYNVYSPLKIKLQSSWGCKISHVLYGCRNYNKPFVSYFINIYIRVITKLPNSEQSYKGKVKTLKYINRQNQSTTCDEFYTIMGNISILNAIINYFDVIYPTQNRSVTLQVSFDKFKINILIKSWGKKNVM